MTQKQAKISKKVGHNGSSKYPFSKITGTKPRFQGKRTKREKIYPVVKDLVDRGVTNITAIGKSIGKSRKQTRRYIQEMERMGMVKFNPETRTLLKENRSEYAWLAEDSFANIPVISKWMDDCVARQVKPRTMYQYLTAVKYIFNKINVNPKDAVSSKKSAIETWTRFIVARRKERPDAVTHGFRISYKNFIASHEIIFPPRMGKMYGLSSAHDNNAIYAGVNISSDTISDIGKMILDDGDFTLYVWWRIGLRTGGRKSAISTMMWNRVYFDEKNEDGSESFKLEQHETKDPRGQYHIGVNGEWKTKYPPLDLKKLLLEWKSKCGNPKFLWFRDNGSDYENRVRARAIGIALTLIMKTE